MSATITTPVLAPMSYPHITHAGGGYWHTKCNVCDVLLAPKGAGIGEVASERTVHMTLQHNQYGLDENSLVTVFEADVDSYITFHGEIHSIEGLADGSYTGLLEDDSEVVVWVRDGKPFVNWKF